MRRQEGMYQRGAEDEEGGRKKMSVKGVDREKELEQKTDKCEKMYGRQI